MAGNTTHGDSPGALATLFPSFNSLFARGRNVPAPPQTAGNRIIDRAVRVLSKSIGFGAKQMASVTAAHDRQANYQQDGSSLQGSASTSMPSAALYQRTQQVYDRRAIIRDCWELFYTDPNVERACWKAARAAVGAGWDFKCSPKEGVAPRQAKRAQAEIDAMLQRCGLTDFDGSPNTDELAAWVIMARVTGDLFQQRVWEKGADGSLRIISLLTMPSESMERLTDLNDQFYSPDAAFMQIDVASQQKITDFKLHQIYHGRWKRLGADRYGNPDFAQGRGVIREQALLEDFQGIRRKTHAAQKVEHSVGSDERPTDWQDVKKYQEVNGIGEQAAYVANDPLHQVNEYFHNGRVKISFHDGDPNLHHVEDLDYMLERTALALDIPMPLLYRALGDTSRDTLEYLDKSWREGLAPDAKFAYRALMSAICTQLLFLGINPLSLNMSLSPRTTTLETAMDRANFVKALSQNTLGAGMSAKPYPLGTPEHYMTILAPDLGITDPKQAVKEIATMLEEFHIDADTLHDQQQQQLASQSVTKPLKGGASVGAANSKNAPGGASKGYGKKFENGKSKQSGARKPGEGYKAG